MRRRGRFWKRRGEGIERVAFTAVDSAAGAEEIRARGYPPIGPTDFERPVTMPDGTLSAAKFRTFQWPTAEAPGGVRIFACQHKTRETVWIPELMKHANGAKRLRQVLIVTPDPAKDAAHLSRMIDRDAQDRGRRRRRRAVGRRPRRFRVPDQGPTRQALSRRVAGRPARTRRRGLVIAADLAAAEKALGTTGVRSANGVVEQDQPSQARHIKAASAGCGVDVAIVEAMEPGWGASGRNNGQVIPTLSRPDPEDIIAKHGAVGERFVGLLRDSASTLFDVARRHRIDAEQEQAGWVQPVHSPGRIKIAERRVRQWSKFGAPVELLSREQVRDMLGSDAWYGGFWNRTGGHINPLALARGLARAVLGLDGRIYARSPAASFERRDNKWVVKTDKGEISGRALVVATNAYSGEFSKSLVPDIANEVMPVLSWQMATQPISDNVRKTIIPGRQAMSDTHGELYFARYDARNRLVTGGAVIGPGNKAERLRARVTERLQRLWPQIGDVSFDYVWNGYVGMTTDFLPRIHRLGPDAYGWTGCNGRAVALAIPLGNELAKAVRGVPVKDLALPFTEPVPIPAHGLLRKLAPLMLLAYRRRDAREIA